MQSSTLILLAVTAATFLAVANAQGSHGFFTGGSWGSDEEKRLDTCQPLISRKSCGCSSAGNTQKSHETGLGSEEEGSGSDESGEGGDGGDGGVSKGGWNKGDLCLLLQGCGNITISIEEENTVWIEWIKRMQLEYVQNVKLTIYEVIVNIAAEYNLLCDDHPTIRSETRYVFVADFFYLFELDTLGLDINWNGTFTVITKEETITSSDDEGSCPCTDACDEWAGEDEDKKTAVAELTEQIKVIVKSSGSSTIKFSKCHDVILKWKAKYTSYWSSLSTTEIKGWANFAAFFKVCQTHWRLNNLETSCGGDSTSNLIVKGLQKIEANTSFDISVRSEIKQVRTSWQACLNDKTITTYTERLANFSKTCYQFLIESEFMIDVLLEVEISEEYGTLAELFQAYTFQDNYDIDCGCEDESGETTTEAAETTTEAVTTTTEAVTTTEPVTTTEAVTTTTEPTTTEAAEGKCSDVTTVVEWDSTTQTNLLLTSITKAQQTDTFWTNNNNSQTKSFQVYYNRMKNVCSNSSYTDEEKFTSVRQVLTGFTTSTTQKYKAVMEIEITGGWKGQIQDFCNCKCSGNSCSDAPTTVPPPTYAGSA